MMFVNFPVEKIKRTFLLLVQRAEQFKETYIADKNKNVQKHRGQIHARFVSLMCMKCLFFGGERQ